MWINHITKKEADEHELALINEAFADWESQSAQSKIEHNDVWLYSDRHPTESLAIHFGTLDGGPLSVSYINMCTGTVKMFVDVEA